MKQTNFASAKTLQEAARRLSKSVSQLRFASPVHTVYNPLDYAWDAHAEYLTRFGGGEGRVLFLGMNPGPYGMMQTGIPFGEIRHVRDWMQISAQIRQPKHMHPKRPIQGFECTREEVSGKRLWGWAAQQSADANTFFRKAFVMNYCPLVFLEESGRNLTPDKLPISERKPLHETCDRHLKRALELLAPSWVIGVGAYASKRLATIIEELPEAARPRAGQILHPSPASPLANRGWAAAATAQLNELGIDLNTTASAVAKPR